MDHHTNGVHTNGRQSNGRYASGNAGGPGNPFARRVAELRKMMFEEASPDDLRQVIRAMIDEAKGGNVQAAKLVLSYLLGKPEPMRNPDTQDIEELEQLDRASQAVEGMHRSLTNPSATVACGIHAVDRRACDVVHLKNFEFDELAEIRRAIMSRKAGKKPVCNRHGPCGEQRNGHR